MNAISALKVALATSLGTLALVGAVGCSSQTPSSVGTATNQSSTTTNSTTSNPATAEYATMTAADAVAQGYQVFKGTIRVCTGEELIELQGLDINSVSMNNRGTYAVLVFDEPTNVTGASDDGSGQRSASSKMLGLADRIEYSNFSLKNGDLQTYTELDGQNVTMAAMAANIVFPSDSKLPVGEPYTYDAIFVS